MSIALDKDQEDSTLTSMDAEALVVAEQAFLSAARSFLVERQRFAQLSGLSGFDTFNGARRMFNVLGYPERLTLRDYQDRFDRGGIAKRIVSCGPKSMGWTKLAVVENNDPKKVTKFETQWNGLFDRTNLGSIIKRADIMAGIGEYSAIFVGVKERGAVGNDLLLQQPISRLSGPDDVVYFRPLGQEDAEIVEYVGDTSDDSVSDERYGLAKFYNIKLTKNAGRASKQIKVHWSRIIHVTHEPLSNELFSAPELQAVWNYLCDLDKLVGGGAEITWKQALQKTLYDLDKDIGPDGLSAKKSGDPGRVIDDKKVKAFQDSLAKLSSDLEDMEHNLRNSALSRGVTPKTIDTKVSDFSSNTKVILSLIAATVEKPQRVLFGAEAGQLASSQDEDTDDDFTESRRDNFGTPLVRQIVDRLISFNALVKPAQYEPLWPTEEDMNEVEKAGLVNTLTGANANQHNADGTIILTNDEIRDRVFQLEPLPKPEVVEPVIDPTTVDPFAEDLSVNEKFKLSSTQINLTSPHRETILLFASNIPEDQLAEDGREDNPHITVKYGIESDNADLVSVLVSDFGSISYTFGKVEMFESDEFDVVFVSVVSNDLTELNSLISDSLKVTDTHSEYVPHATIAYVKSGTGKQYVGASILDGVQVVTDTIVFSSSDDIKTEIQTNQAN